MSDAEVTTTVAEEGREAANELPTGAAAIAEELEQARGLAASIESQTTNLINREIYEAKYRAGRIPRAKALSSLNTLEQEEAIAEHVYPIDTEDVIKNDGLDLGLSRLLRAYRNFITGANTGAANPEAAQLLVEPIEKLAGKEQADALLSSIPTTPNQQFNRLLSTINREARASVAETIRKEILPKYARLDESLQLKTSAYKGKALSNELTDIARKGNFKQLLTRLAPSQSPEIKRVIRKISSLGLTTKLVVAPMEEGQNGSYDPVTDTITLDPSRGLTEHAFLHEATHAAIAQALNDRNNPLTKQFFDFYSSIVVQFGDTYAGSDFQEFAAELVSNPEFQALLKETKAPESKSMWQTIMEAIARFFGFRTGQNNYTKGLDFIDKILDVSQGVEPTLTDKLFLGTPANSMQAMSDILTKKPLW